MGDFYDLPVELRIRVLQHLPALDVVRFQQVSRSSKQIITSSQELRYKIECFLAGAVDASPDSSYPIVNRLRDLTCWRERWKRMKWSQKRDLPPYDGDKSLVCVSGPVCARQASKLKPHVAIEFNKLSSPSRGVTATSWRLNSLCDHDTFAFDYYQDLLVLVESSPGRNEVTVHFLTCTTGAPHPAAKHASHKFTLPTDEPVGSFKTQICGDLVGLHYEYWAPAFFELWVSDWRIGKTLLNLGIDIDMEEHEIEIMPQGFAFLDARHVLVVTGAHSATRVLAVFDCYNITTSQRLFFPDAMRHRAALVLDLPHLARRYSADTLNSVECNPHSSRAVPSRIEGVVFRPAGTPVVLVTIWTNDKNDGELRYDLLIPGRAILSRLAQRNPTGTRLSWQAYSLECRLFNVTDRSFASVCGFKYASGGKVWQYNHGNEGEGHFVDVAVIYHFDEPASICRDTEDDNGEEEDDVIEPAVYRVIEPFDMSNCDVWAEPAKTGAWYLQTWTDIVLGLNQGFFLAEDGLLVHEHDGRIIAYTI